MTIQRFLSSVGVAVLAGVAFAAQAATISISSRDPAGVGFNDPTAVAPVGGNPGTTLGEQRFNVYRYVANIWEAAIQSPVTITVSAGWEALTCTATSRDARQRRRLEHLARLPGRRARARGTRRRSPTSWRE